MVLRNCIEILRENQKQAANKVRLFSSISKGRMLVGLMNLTVHGNP